MMRRWRGVFFLIILFVIVLGAVMIGKHGIKFFVFRSAGTGQSPDSFLSENQGPGQPDAPKSLLALRATMPDGTRITFRRAEADTWAGVSQLRSGKWAVLADGTARKRVTSATSSSWTAHEDLYRAQWEVVPVRRAQ
jgi:hypothetical protein